MIRVFFGIDRVAYTPQPAIFDLRRSIIGVSTYTIYGVVRPMGRRLQAPWRAFVRHARVTEACDQVCYDRGTHRVGRRFYGRDS